jgi:hypothetical protein
MNPMEIYNNYVKKYKNEQITPMDDKSRLHEYLELLHNPDSPMISKTWALEGIGLIASKYGADFVITCGSLPAIKKALNSTDRRLVHSAALSIIKIARHGGYHEIVEENIHKDLERIALNSSFDFLLKNLCVTALGWILLKQRETWDNIIYTEN